MDISDTLAPNGDQLDAIELIAGPRVFTVERVTAGNAEQPVNVYLAEFPRAWRPGKSMRRVLAACWGNEASEWTGRRVELFCDTEVVFGGKAVGGTRIKRLSHIDKAQKIPLLVTRGKSAIYVVDPLPDAPAPHPNEAKILEQIQAAAEKAGVPLADVATEWAETHGGQKITDATDMGGLELLRDDLIGRAS